MTQSQHRPLAATIYAKDREQLACIYETVLGLERGEQGAGFSVLVGEAVELIVVQVPDAIAEGIEITRPPLIREETPIKLSFLVPAIEGLRASVEAAGGGLKEVGAAWSWRGQRHLDGWDPEGNVIQLREREEN